MTIRVIVAACALGLMPAAGVGAQAQVPTAGEETGTVARVDERHGVIVLNDGRMFRVTPSTVVLMDGRSVPFRALEPGRTVAIRSGEPVVYREGQYASVAGAPAAGGLPADAVRQTIYGQVSDVDRDGAVRIKTPDGRLKIMVSPDAARSLKKGDTATIDVTVTPPAPRVR